MMVCMGFRTFRPDLNFVGVKKCERRRNSQEHCPRLLVFRAVTTGLCGSVRSWL